ncbi:MAG TPA: hypothetical protein VHC94_17500 [Nitrobacter sp.]|jgi:localization factor PodJL|nr:hypothetical protein [Nitrobacter sp.]
MNSRGSWNVDGIEPSVRERAEAAARRAGMSLNDWLNSSLGNAAPDSRDAPPPPPPVENAPNVAEIHQRLDSITRQIDQMSAPPPRGEPMVARQLNDAISRLDARLAQITSPQPARQPFPQAPHRPTDMVERAAARVYDAAPPLNPASLEFAIAEISARQNELNGPPRSIPSYGAPPIAPAQTTPLPPGPDFSGLERQLSRITSQIETLQRPDGIERSIAAFRDELAQIRHAITEALPREAIESIESEIRSLSQRIDDSRQHGTDHEALASIERALNDIYNAVRSLKPAEQLAGFDEAIHNLGAKIDSIVRTSGESGGMEQLEGAIAALRGIVSNVASNDALARLSDELHTLSAKVDQLGRFDGQDGTFAALEQRIAALTTTLENRERPAAAANPEQLEGALRALSDRLDHLPVNPESASAFTHLEQRISALIERLEATADHRSGHASRIEDGLQNILRQLERQHAGLAALTETANRGPAAPMDPGLVDAIKRELSDMRYSQSETDRRTQDSLEVVHNTLGHVVDRLAMIEGDLRSSRSAPPIAPAAPTPAMSRGPAPAAPPPPRPELPNPVLSQLAAAPQPAPAPPVAPRSIGDILVARDPVSEPPASLRAAQPRPAINPDLPPDHPLEPGTRAPGAGISPSERIAASESAIQQISGAERESASSSSFIAAARRAAQAAAAATPAAEKPARAKATAETLRTAAAGASSNITSRIRSLLVGASVVAIVLGGVKVTMSFLDGGRSATVAQSKTTPVAPKATTGDAPKAEAPAAAPAPALPSMTSPTPIDRQSMNGPAPADTPPAPTASTANTDVTGSIPSLSSEQKSTRIQIPAAETLPDSIGGPRLRKAALGGDAAAAYEIGARYAEGKGVAINYGEAAKWYDRAAQAGVIPAMFRLGTLYEKGLGVTKDVDIARRYYVQAAERGNAKAMHNIAVLDADGGGKGPNYQSAAEWFRKAADRGVADSQFNLGILYARGIGVQQNLAESYKWFSLAAAQGDADAGRKRDDIAKRLDPQSLAAAKLAVQTFKPERQPDDAVNVAGPAGGWDNAAAAPAASATTRAAAAKPATSRRASR